jgi:hypothetical protein
MNKRRGNGTADLPHGHVYTRLRPSRVHKGGVGVFAIRDIKKGAHLFPGDDDNMVWVEKGKVARTPLAIRKLYQDFAVLKGGRFGAPPNFNLLTVAWYLNEPKAGEKANVYCQPKTYQFFAARDIRAGEELTVDYSTYSDRDGVTESRRKRSHAGNGVAA